MTKKGILNYAQEREAALLYSQGKNSCEIARLMGVSKSYILKILHKHGAKMRNRSESKRQYKIDETFFDRIDTQEKAYVLGFLYGDGATTPLNSTVFAQGPASDIQVYNDMNLAMKSERPVTVSKKGHADWRFSSIKMRTRLFELGVVPNKTKIIKFPFEHLSPYLYRHFIRGLFDSDGCIYLVKDRRGNRYVGSWTIYSTQDMLNSVREIMANCDISLNTLAHDKRCYSNSAIIGTNKCESLHQIYKFLYEGEKICLKRKQTKFQQVLALKPRAGLVASRSCTVPS